MFTFKDKFKLEQGMSTKELITYNLKSDKGNSIEIIFTLRGDGRNNTKLNIAVKYEGEKEWIVGKYLKEIVESIIKSLKNELEKRYELETKESFSKQLGKLSFISKLLMKSRLVKSEEIEVRRGMLADILLTIIQDLMRYQLIYVSGTSESSSFRVYVK